MSQVVFNEKCHFCQKDYNFDERGDLRDIIFRKRFEPTWKYLPIGKSAHADCYIEHVCKQMIEEKIK